MSSSSIGRSADRSSGGVGSMRWLLSDKGRRTNDECQRYRPSSFVLRLFDQHISTEGGGAPGEPSLPCRVLADFKRPMTAAIPRPVVLSILSLLTPSLSKKRR